MLLTLNYFILLFSLIPATTFPQYIDVLLSIYPLSIVVMLYFFITLLHLSENSSLPIPLLLLGYAKLFYDRDNSFFLPYTSQPIFVKLIVYFLIGIGWSMLKLRLYIKYGNGKNYIVNICNNSNRAQLARDILRDNKVLIYSWILYWPLNIIYTCMNDSLLFYIEKVYYNIIENEVSKYIENIVERYTESEAESEYESEVEAETRTVTGDGDGVENKD